MNIALFIALFALVSAEAAVSSLELKCDEQIKASDGCLMNAILIGRDNLTLPRTTQELDSTLCSGLNEDFRCVLTMRRCFKPVLRTIFSEIIRSSRQTLKSLCKTPKQKQETIDALMCFKQEDIMLLKSIIDKFTSVLDYGSKNEPSNSLIGYTCCGYFFIAEETKRELDTLCSSRNHVDGSKLILKIIAAIAGDTEVGCGRFSSAEACRTHLPSSTVIAAQLNKNNGTDRVYKSFSPLIPMLHVFDRLDSDS